LFQGRFEHNLDDKGRLAIPAPFRKRLIDDSGEGLLMVTISDQCLAAYPLADWEVKLAQLAKLNQLDPRVAALKRIFVGCAQECPIDKAGRILLPADLRRDSQIEKECVVLGQLEKFEIWSGERWNRNFAALSDQVGAIYAALAEHGISL
jgi:MraZ protein